MSEWTADDANVYLGEDAQAFGPNVPNVAKVLAEMHNHDVRQMQQRIAVLEAQLQAAALRAERLRVALRRCERMGNAIGKRSWEELRDVTWAALAATPDASPLRQVAGALVHLRDELSQWEAATHLPSNYRTQIEECKAALRLLAELGVSDAP